MPCILDCVLAMNLTVAVADVSQHRQGNPLCLSLQSCIVCMSKQGTTYVNGRCL